MSELEFGKCECGGKLFPIYFTEEETKIINGALCKTGRKRRAVNVLRCEACLKSYCVDDSFDEKWV